MEEITLEKAGINDFAHIFEMRSVAFSSVYKKYQGKDVKPFAESLAKIIECMNNPSILYYFIRLQKNDIGVICLQRASECVTKILDIFILEQYQNHGYAYQALVGAEALYPQSLMWSLEAIKEEPELCHLCEKAGYIQTEQDVAIHDKENDIHLPEFIIKYEKNKVPKAFTPIRRKDRALSTKEAYDILTHGLYGTLSVMSGDGYPYGVAMNYACDKDKIYIHCACAPDLPGSKNADKIIGKKVADFTRNPKVCFSVFCNEKNIPEKFSTDYESVVVFGTIKKSFDKKEIIKKIIEKYCPDYTKEGDEFSIRLAPVFETYEITIEHITAKARRLG